jgi:hypothetical protein
MMGGVGEEPEVAWRIDALRARLPADGSLPRELTILGLPSRPGRCPSCGDPQPYGQTGKCTLCCLASAALLQDLAGQRTDRVPWSGMP